MNRKLLVVVISIVLLISLAITYVLVTPKKDMVSHETAKSSLQQNTTAQVPAQTNERNGAYIDYSADSIASTTGTKVLFFHAPWCPQCREIEDTIKQNGVPTGVTVIKIDYDSNQLLRKRYGVTLQTTFVKIDDSGNKIASYVAYDEPQFSSVERELLK